ncbi:MAG: HAD family hydrolase [Eubacteriales bacterium]
MKNITTICSDFDGTILKHGAQKVEESFFSLLKEVMEQGITFIAASGRQYPNLRLLMEPVADQISYIGENGAVVVCNNKIIHKSVIEKNLANQLLQDMQQTKGADIVAAGEANSYIRPTNKPLIKHLLEVVKYHVITVDTYESIEDELVKISMFFKEGIPEDIVKEFKEKYQDRLQIVDAGNNWLDFTNLEASKGHALQILAEYQNFKMEDVVAFGDSENDITMLREAGFSYAMNTAKDHVKAAADAECEYVEEIMKQLFI